MIIHKVTEEDSGGVDYHIDTGAFPYTCILFDNQQVLRDVTSLSIENLSRISTLKVEDQSHIDPETLKIIQLAMI